MKTIMNNFLHLDTEKCKKIVDIKSRYMNGDISFEEARKEALGSFEFVTAAEFAYGEQMLKDAGIDDETMNHKMDEVLKIFDDLLIPEVPELPEGHPIRSYEMENEVIRGVTARMRTQLERKFIKNEWLEIYDRLLAYDRHYIRKHNQLFPFLEMKGFDRPTVIMWSFDDQVRRAIKRSYQKLVMDKVELFLKSVPDVIEKIEDMLYKEENILFPTALRLLSEDDFRKMRLGEDEAGFANIPIPTGFLPEGAPEPVSPSAAFQNELDALLKKYNLPQEAASHILPVSHGRLTLKQINLIYQHLPLDITFVDENDIVRFYSDTKERIFDRSQGVIGRKVQNCHPREVLPIVNRILEDLRTGESDMAEFFTRKKDKEIHIQYIAVHDEEGNYRGCLETMQDVTGIRNYGKRNIPVSRPKPQEEKKEEASDNAPITLDTTLHTLLSRYPYMKDFLVSLSPSFKLLNKPAMVAVMGRVADIKTIAFRGGFKPEVLLAKILTEIEKHK